MGVKDLWSILEDIKTKCSLSSLANQTLAVDLSIWVVENENVNAMQGVVEKPYLRNIFYRVMKLRRLGIKLIFVIEGKAPQLKIGEMDRRTQVRCGIAGAGRGSRLNFDAKLKECKEMLRHLGMPCIQSSGEAEAMCAALNYHGDVDGVITDDGDAFLYGAQTVYRNLTLEKKDPHMICYKIEDMKQKLDLDRNKLVVLGLLLGCDYLPKGVPGVGKEKAYELMSQWGDDAIERFESWKSLDEESPCKEKAKPRHCKLCRHIGTDKKHAECGCGQCGTQTSCIKQDRGESCSCHFCQEQSNLEVSKIERCIMRKAKTTDGFPFTKVSNEFLSNNETPPSQSTLHWTRPNLPLLQNFTSVHMNWNKQKTTQQILPLLTYCEISTRRYRHSTQETPEGISNSTQAQVVLDSSTQAQVVLDSLLRLTKKDKVSSFEVQWAIPGQTGDHGDQQLKLTTYETEADIQNAYPDEYIQFQKAHEKSSPRKSPKKSPARSKGLNSKTVGDSTSGKRQSTLTNFFKITKRKVPSTTTEDKAEHNEQQNTKPRTIIDLSEEKINLCDEQQYKKPRTIIDLTEEKRTMQIGNQDEKSRNIVDLT